jgi:hypothetical protein
MSESNPNFRDRLSQGLLACLLIVLVALAPTFYALNALQMRSSSLQHADVHQVTPFASALRDYSLTYGSLPGPSLQVAVQTLRRFEQETNHSYSVDWNLVAAGRTPYGGPLIYEWIDNGKAARIRSTGPGMVDDGGKSGQMSETVSLASQTGMPAH